MEKKIESEETLLSAEEMRELDLFYAQSIEEDETIPESYSKANSISERRKTKGFR